MTRTQTQNKTRSRYENSKAFLWTLFLTQGGSVHFYCKGNRPRGVKHPINYKISVRGHLKWWDSKLERFPIF